MIPIYYINLRILTKSIKENIKNHPVLSLEITMINMEMYFPLVLSLINLLKGEYANHTVLLSGIVSLTVCYKHLFISLKILLYHNLNVDTRFR